MKSYQDWKALEGVTLKGVTVTLRCLHAEDVDVIGKWRNDELLRTLLAIDYPVSHARITEWVHGATTNSEGNPMDIPLGICVDQELIGTAGLHDISMRHRHATLGIYVGEEKFRHMGIGRVVYSLLLKFAFQELDLRCLSAYVYGNNEASQKLHKRSEFQECGRIPQWENRDAAYQDFITYYISKEQWLTLNK